jgi:hypothetical protein
VASSNYTFRWRIKQSFLERYGITPDQSEKTITLTSENNPRFDSFVPIIADGVDLRVDELILWERENGASTGYGLNRVIKYESDMFANQTGCRNGVDIQGNLIDAVSLSVFYNEERFFEFWANQTFAAYDLTIVLFARKLRESETSLADIYSGGWGLSCNDIRLISMVVTEGYHWAVVEFVVQLNKTSQTGDSLSALQGYGTHPIGQLLSNYVNARDRHELPQIGASATDSVEISMDNVRIYMLDKFKYQALPL